MKTLKISISLLALSLYFLTIGCGGGDDDSVSNACGANFNLGVEINAEVMALSDAATIYAMDPTPENCNAYKVAAQAYLDAVAGYEDCAQLSGQGDEYAQAIADAEASIDAIQC